MRRLRPRHYKKALRVPRRVLLWRSGAEELRRHAAAVGEV